MVAFGVSSRNAFVTLVSNDGYCPGALVLAYSLRLVNSQAKIVCFISKQVSKGWIDRLEEIFNEIYLVDEIKSLDHSNLELLGRPDLDITFTKFHLWNLTEFDKGKLF